MSSRRHIDEHDDPMWAIAHILANYHYLLVYLAIVATVVAVLTIWGL